MDSNVFKQLDVVENNKSNAVQNAMGDDIDSILEYLEDKNKKKDKSKLPLLNNTRDKFYKPAEKKEILRQSKTELKHGQYKHYEKDDWKNIKNNPTYVEDKLYGRDQNSSYRKYVSNPLNPLGSMNSLLPASKKQSLPPNKFSYSFQPASIPAYLPQTKNSNKTANLGLGLAYVPLPKANSLLKKDALNPLKL